MPRGKIDRPLAGVDDGMDGCSFGRKLKAIPRSALMPHGCGRGQ
jgi:hypothetical protein